LDPTDALSTVAELAVAFAGFSGIVAALDRREQGSLFPEDRMRFAALIGASLSTTAFALLPFALLEMFSDASHAWAVSSAVYVPYAVTIIFVLERNLRRARLEDPDLIHRVSSLPLRVSSYVGFPLVIVLQLANVMFWQKFSPFFAALLWGLAGCAIGFLGLVRSLHR